MAGKTMTVRERALGYLARREHTRAELARKLAPYCEEHEDITALLDDFTERGWISEARYTDMLVTARQGKYGSRRVAQELREKGVSEETIAAALPDILENDVVTARAVWARKFGVPASDAAERARQIRFLLGRGFPLDTVYKALGGNEE